MKIIVMSQKRGWEIDVKAILSTTVLPLDGIYRVTRILTPTSAHIEGIPHYIGHPDTKRIVEEMGAVKAESNLFEGLRPGEAALCFAIKQGKSTRKEDGFTTPHQDVTLDDLDVRVVERLECSDYCSALPL